MTLQEAIKVCSSLLKESRDHEMAMNAVTAEELANKLDLGLQNEALSVVLTYADIVAKSNLLPQKLTERLP